MSRDGFIAILGKSALLLLCLFPLLLAVTRAGADGAVSMIGIMFLLHSALSKNWQWTRRLEVRLLIALWIYLSLNGLWVAGTDKHALYMLVYLRFIVFYAAVTSWLLVDSESVKKVARWGLPVIGLLLIDSYWQYMTGLSLSGRPLIGEVRLTGPMSNANIGNLLLKCSLPFLGIAAYQLARHPDKRPLFALMVFALLILALIPLTGERSITLLTFMAVGVIGLGFMLLQPRLRKHAACGLLLFLAVFAALFATQDIIAMRAKFLVEQLSDFSASPYGQLYIASFRLWQEQPFFGIGVGQFWDSCNLIAKQYSITYCDIHSHNIYMQWLSETGAVGFLLFVSSMIVIVRRFLKTTCFREAFVPAIFSLAALAVLLFPAIVTQSIFSNWPAMIFWYGLSMAICAPRVASHE